jgi:hypothetical protein
MHGAAMDGLTELQLSFLYLLVIITGCNGLCAKQHLHDSVSPRPLLLNVIHKHMHVNMQTQACVRTYTLYIYIYI